MMTMPFESTTPNPCLSSEKLLEENVRYLRFMFDMFDVPAMSVWPDDGFTSMIALDERVYFEPPRGDDDLAFTNFEEFGILVPVVEVSTLGVDFHDVSVSGIFSVLELRR